MRARAARRLGLAAALASLLGVMSVAHAVTVEDAVALAEAGVSEELIVEAIVRDETKLELSDGDRARLKQAGLSAKVARAFAGPAPAPTPVEQAAPEGKAAPVGKAAPPADARARAEDVREAERRRAEEERAKRAAERGAEAERLRREAAALGGAELDRTRGADAGRLIDSAYESLDDGEISRAAVIFDQIVGGRLAAPNTAAYADASYGLAEALTRLGLPSAAPPLVVEVLRHGPAAPRFDEALRLLARYATRFDYTHPVLELLDGVELEGRSAELRDEHAWMVGGYRARFGDHDRARTRLMSIRPDGPRGPAAAYRLGLVEVAAGRPIEGLRAFESAVTLSERRGDLGTRDLAYLALARIAYEVGRFDAAIDYYRRIGAASGARARARYELIWPLLLSGDDAGALAALHVAEADRHADHLALDLGLLEATIFLDLCRYDEARARTAAFQQEIAPLLTFLDRAVELPAAEAHAAALAHPALRRIVQSDVDTHVAAQAAAELASEERRLAGLTALGALADRLRPALADRRRALGDQAAAAALRRLRALRLELADLAVSADEVRLEADLAEREVLYGAEGDGAVVPVAPAAVPPRVAPGQALWQVDDERWLDEENDHVSGVTSACPVETR